MIGKWPGHIREMIWHFQHQKALELARKMWSQLEPNTVWICSITAGFEEEGFPDLQWQCALRWTFVTLSQVAQLWPTIDMFVVSWVWKLKIQSIIGGARVAWIVGEQHLLHPFFRWLLRWTSISWVHQAVPLCPAAHPRCPRRNGGSAWSLEVLHDSKKSRSTWFWCSLDLVRSGFVHKRWFLKMIIVYIYMYLIVGFSFEYTMGVYKKKCS